MIGRRNFISQWVLGSILASCRCSGDPESSKDSNLSGKSVLIIGAGISGIAAARSLTDMGVDVRVLESRDRIGGRIFTDNSLGFPVDLGAAWIHGTQGNPVTDLAIQSGIQRTATDFDARTLYRSDGKPFTNDEGTYAAETTEKILEVLGQMSSATSQDKSVRSAITEIGSELDSASLDSKLLRIVEAVLEESTGGASEKISLKHEHRGEFKISPFIPYA